MVTKVNPTTDYTQARSFLGKTITVLDIASGVDLSGENGPDGALKAIMQVLASRATIVAYGPLTNTNQDIQVWVEGEFPDSDYDGDGSDEAFEAVLQAELQALTSVGDGPVSLGAATVTESLVLRADDVDDIA